MDGTTWSVRDRGLHGSWGSGRCPIRPLTCGSILMWCLYDRALERGQRWESRFMLWRLRCLRYAITRLVSRAPSSTGGMSQQSQLSEQSEQFQQFQQSPSVSIISITSAGPTQTQGTASGTGGALNWMLLSCTNYRMLNWLSCTNCRFIEGPPYVPLNAMGYWMNLFTYVLHVKHPSIWNFMIIWFMVYELVCNKCTPICCIVVFNMELWAKIRFH